MKSFILLLFASSSVWANPLDLPAAYPRGPNPSVTPGSLCTKIDTYRYPERIAYCGRDVDSEIKAGIFVRYRSLGYKLDISRRSDYKIDHLIPLCAGGSNEIDNLWPQHMSVFNQTDPLESVGCQKLQAALIKQTELVKLILAAKKDLSLVPETLSYLKQL